MTEEEKLQKAFELYRENHYYRTFGDTQRKKEWEEYNVSNELLDKWDNEYAIERYNELKSILSNEEEHPLNKYLFLIIDQLTHFSPTHENYCCMVDSLEQLNQKGILLNLFDPYERSYCYTLDLLLTGPSRIYNRYEKISFWLTGHEFDGLLPYLYYANEIKLYNGLFDIVLSVFKIKGIQFQVSIERMMYFTEVIGDIENNKKIKDAVEYCKEHNTYIDEYFHEWKI